MHYFNHWNFPAKWAHSGKGHYEETSLLEKKIVVWTDIIWTDIIWTDICVVTNKILRVSTSKTWTFSLTIEYCNLNLELYEMYLILRILKIFSTKKYHVLVFKNGKSQLWLTGCDLPGTNGTYWDPSTKTRGCRTEKTSCIDEWYHNAQDAPEEKICY